MVRERENWVFVNGVLGADCMKREMEKSVVRHFILFFTYIYY